MPSSGATLLLAALEDGASDVADEDDGIVDAVDEDDGATEAADELAGADDLVLPPLLSLPPQATKPIIKLLNSEVLKMLVFSWIDGSLPL